MYSWTLQRKKFVPMEEVQKCLQSFLFSLLLVMHAEGLLCLPIVRIIMYCEGLLCLPIVWITMYWEGHQNRQRYKEMKEQLEPFQASMFWFWSYLYIGCSSFFPDWWFGVDRCVSAHGELFKTAQTCNLWPFSSRIQSVFWTGAFLPWAFGSLSKHKSSKSVNVLAIATYILLRYLLTIGIPVVRLKKGKILSFLVTLAICSLQFLRSKICP